MVHSIILKINFLSGEGEYTSVTYMNIFTVSISEGFARIIGNVVIVGS